MVLVKRDWPDDRKQTLFEYTKNCNHQITYYTGKVNVDNHV